MESIAVLIPTERAGCVIGKAGSGLKQIRATTTCHVALEQETDPTGMRRAEISGPTIEHIATAFQQVVERAFQQEAVCTVIIRIPEVKAGVVIGKGGENLKRVRSTCGVEVSVERNPITVAITGTQERLVTLQGDVHNMRQALVLALAGQALGGMQMQMMMQVPFAAAGKFSNRDNQQVAGLSQVRPASNNPDAVQVHMVIPDSCAGAILGKEGAGLKDTAANAGCNITVTKRDGQTDRRVVFMGDFASCASGQMVVHTQHMEAARQAGKEVTDASVVYFLPKDAAGAIIGKEAQTLKQLREEAGVRITLYRDVVEGQRACSISGDLHNVLKAERLILEKVRSHIFATGPPGGNVVSSGVGEKRQLPASTWAVGPPEVSVAKRPRLDGRGGDQTKLLVPLRSAGAVIGKQGCMLKQLRESCGVHIEVLQQVQAPQWQNDRVVILRGSATARLAALNAVMGIAFHIEHESAVLKMLVEATLAGFLIGKQGSVLRAIREQCGVAAHVERGEVLGERLVTAQGSLTNLSGLASVVLSILENSVSIDPEEGGAPQEEEEEYWEAEAPQGVDQWSGVPYPYVASV